MTKVNRAQKARQKRPMGIELQLEAMQLKSLSGKYTRRPLRVVFVGMLVVGGMGLGMLQWCWRKNLAFETIHTDGFFRYGKPFR